MGGKDHRDPRRDERDRGAGLRAVEDPYHVHDIHASILYLLGLDHLKTTYMHNGRAERPTRTGGKLITKLWT